MKNKKLNSHSQIIAARKYDLCSSPLPKTALCATICENSGDTILLHELISPQNLMKSKSKSKNKTRCYINEKLSKSYSKVIVARKYDNVGSARAVLQNVNSPAYLLLKNEYNNSDCKIVLLELI